MLVSVVLELAQVRLAVREGAVGLVNCVRKRLGNQVLRSDGGRVPSSRRVNAAVQPILASVRAVRSR